MLKSATEVCCCRLVGQGTIKRSDRWNDKLRSAVVQKRKVFEQWLQQQAFDNYREERRKPKALVRKTKKDAENRFGTKFCENF